MIDDPIVAEVRAVRAKMMEEFDYDLGKFLNHIRELERQHPERLIMKEQLDALRGKQVTQQSPAPRFTLDRALGIASGNAPAPDDATVKKWIEEHRQQKCG